MFSGVGFLRRLKGIYDNLKFKRCFVESDFLRRLKGIYDNLKFKLEFELRGVKRMQCCGEAMGVKKNKSKTFKDINSGVK